MTDPGRIFAGKGIIIPGATTDLWQTVIRLSHGKVARFIWPLEGKITSPFGWRNNPVTGERQRHNGIDIDVPVGTIVHAAAPGKVYFTGEDSGYGTMIILQHSDNYYTVYGHLSSILVSKGQYVEVGQPIAESGNTGLSTGPHLHFEVRNGEFPIDPQRYLPT
ncbi:MAG TPA: M23 family metallopeptidase [Candidatus Acetothermia bacterium]|nr:M23 family metallopeptidase [Candidatus Acetothermia bacterium]